MNTCGSSFAQALQIATVQDRDDIVGALEAEMTTMDALRRVVHAPDWALEEHVLDALCTLTTQEKRYPVFLVLKTSEQVIIETLKARWEGRPVTLKGRAAKVWAAYQAKAPDARPFYLYSRCHEGWLYQSSIDDHIDLLNWDTIHDLADKGRLFPLDRDWLLVFSTPQPTLRKAVQLVHAGAPIQALTKKMNEAHAFEVNSIVLGCTNRTGSSRTWTLYETQLDPNRTLKLQVSPLYLPEPDLPCDPPSV